MRVMTLNNLTTPQNNNNVSMVAGADRPKEKLLKMSPYVLRKEIAKTQRFIFAAELDLQRMPIEWLREQYFLCKVEGDLDMLELYDEQLRGQVSLDYRKRVAQANVDLMTSVLVEKEKGVTEVENTSDSLGSSESVNVSESDFSSQSGELPPSNSPLPRDSTSLGKSAETINTSQSPVVARPSTTQFIDELQKRILFSLELRLENELTEEYLRDCCSLYHDRISIEEYLDRGKNDPHATINRLLFIYQQSLRDDVDEKDDKCAQEECEEDTPQEYRRITSEDLMRQVKAKLDYINRNANGRLANATKWNEIDWDEAPDTVQELDSKLVSMMTYANGDPRKQNRIHEYERRAMQHLRRNNTMLPERKTKVSDKSTYGYANGLFL
jgi:hypothetical protein